MIRDRTQRSRSDDSIIGVCKRKLAKKGGATSNEIRTLVNTNPDRAFAMQFLHDMLAAGKVLKVEQKSLRTVKTLYFASPAVSEEWAATPNLLGWRRTSSAIEAQREAMKSPRSLGHQTLDKDAPAVCAVKPTVIPTGRDYRHTFTGTPGRHVDSSQCRPWAAAFGA